MIFSCNQNKDVWSVIPLEELLRFFSWVNTILTTNLKDSILQVAIKKVKPILANSGMLGNSFLNENTGFHSHTAGLHRAGKTNYWKNMFLKKIQLKDSSSIFYDADNMSISYSFCASCISPAKIFRFQAVTLIYCLCVPIYYLDKQRFHSLSEFYHRCPKPSSYRTFSDPGHISNKLWASPKPTREHCIESVLSLHIC